jgi:pimeloyl-ACP methyl ester carboxylesterase
MSRLIAAALAVLCAAALSPTARAVDCGYNFDQCQSQFAVNGLSGTLYSTLPIKAAHPEIRRVIVIVHGSDANVRNYFSAGLRAAADSGKEAETLVLAPLYVEQQNRDAMDKTKLIWDSNSDWRAGDLSTTAFTPRISAFTVMDEIIAPFADRKVYPNLAKIVIAGHSAGAQFVQRYAVARRDVPGMAPVSYLVANPSSYVYLDERRPVAGNMKEFAVPTGSACNPNLYKYGLEKPNAYMKRDTPAVEIARYRARRVTYLAGDKDTNPNDPGMSRTCAAMAQGSTRFARTTAFAAYMDSFFAPHNHSYAVVPGVGHEFSRMLLSPQGMAALFAD